MPKDKGHLLVIIRRTHKPCVRDQGRGIMGVQIQREPVGDLPQQGNPFIARNFACKKIIGVYVCRRFRSVGHRRIGNGALQILDNRRMQQFFQKEAAVDFLLCQHNGIKIASGIIRQSFQAFKEIVVFVIERADKRYVAGKPPGNFGQGF